MRIKLYLLVIMPLLGACVSVSDQPTKNEKASKINVQLGIGYLQQNNLEQSSEKLSKALRQDPESASAHNAYALLQDRMLQYEKAGYHYERATELDPKDSQAANNYGAFLCRNKREAESVKYFLRALNNPLYKTPEFAYTNAALCLKNIGELEQARDYLKKALAAKSNFHAALLAMAYIEFEGRKYDLAKIYLDRYHLVASSSAKSIWLAIRVELGIDGSANVEELTKLLKSNFPDSIEYQSWLETQ